MNQGAIRRHTKFGNHIYFFTAVKSDLTYGYKPEYGIYIPESDYPILKMYPDVINAEGVRIHVC